MSGLDDRTYIANLYVTHYSDLMKQIVWIQKGEDGAEDILQNTILRLYRGADKLRRLGEYDSPRVRRYALQAAKWETLNALHKQRQENERYVYPGELPEPEAGRPTPEELAEEREGTAALEEKLAALSDRDHDLLYFAYVLDVPAKELCRVLHIREASIYQILSRARRRAKEIIRGGEKL